MYQVDRKQTEEGMIMLLLDELAAAHWFAMSTEKVMIC